MYQLSVVMKDWTLDKVVGARSKIDEVKGFKSHDAVTFEMTKMVMKVQKFSW